MADRVDWEAFVDAYPKPPVEKVFTDARAIASALRLRGAEAVLISQAYRVGASVLGPFQAPHGAAILESLRAEVAARPHRRVAFVGRDGHLIAAGVRALDPEFFDGHCTEIVLSRTIVEAMVQDQETNTKTPSPLGASFRTRRSWAEEHREDIPGTAARVTAYLHRSGLPVGEPGSALTIVDNSLRGTAQEALAAQYPQTDVRGHYIFLTVAPDDTNPDRKRGYAFHLPPEHWQGGTVPFLPHNRALTFLSDPALTFLERLTSGPTYAATRMAEHGPDRSAPENPGSTPAKYELGDSARAARIRQGMRAAIVLGVAHHAQHAAPRSYPPGRDPLTVQARYWLTGDPRVDPVFDRVAGVLSPVWKCRAAPVRPSVALPRSDVAAARREAARELSGPRLGQALAARSRSGASSASVLQDRRRSLERGNGTTFPQVKR